MKNLKNMAKVEMIRKLADLGINVVEPEKVSKSQLAEMIDRAKNEKFEADKAEMLQNPEKAEEQEVKSEPEKKVAKTEKPAKDAKKEKREDAKAKAGEAVDAWLAKFKEEAEGNGKKVVIKTWEKIPTCRSLKVDGVTYFEMYFSANGVRLNAKSELIPEEVRPAGSNIIKNGLDLTIPTFSDISEGLTKYADACRKSLADKAAKKAEEAAAKKAAAEKAKAEKKAKAEAGKETENK